MTVLGVDQKIKRAWQFGESVLAAGCLIFIGYFYTMVYLGVRKRKINNISQVTALIQAKREAKVAKTCGLITGVLILSFAPGIVVVALGDVFPVSRKSQIFRLLSTLIQLNSLVNPLIYFYRDRLFRNAALELLGIEKAKPIQPAVRPAARFTVRRKGSLGSLQARELQAVQERQNEEQHNPVERAASCDPAVVSVCIDRKSREISSKRLMSTPVLDKCIGSVDDLQLQQASSMVITTEIVHTERGGGYQSKARRTELPQDTITAHARYRPHRPTKRGTTHPLQKSINLRPSCGFRLH